LIWIAEAHARQFREPGWVRLEPPREGGVMFVQRERQQVALRVETALRDAPKGRV
jgi:hypothetical protein